MSMSINTNVMSLNAQRNTAVNSASMATTLQRLSSGLRVNSAKDDAAGLAIASRMDTQVRGMNVAIRNANDGISLAQTAEAGLGTITEMLQRMRELAVQAINSTNTTGSEGDVAKLNDEYTQLRAEIGRALSSVRFNGQALLTTASGVGAPAPSAGWSFQVGANSGTENRIEITHGANGFNVGDQAGLSNFLLGTVTAGSGAVTAGWTLDTSSNIANTAVLVALDNAISTVNAARARLGAVQSRFENTINFLRSSVEQQAAAKGRIMDADFAAETSNLSRTQILQQAGTAMIAQANQLPQNVLSLLR